MDDDFLNDMQGLFGSRRHKKDNVDNVVGGNDMQGLFGKCSI
jgi:hypothetical protein